VLTLRRELLYMLSSDTLRKTAGSAAPKDLDGLLNGDETQLNAIDLPDSLEVEAGRDLLGLA